jgi:thioesterase domain-containing protein
MEAGARWAFIKSKARKALNKIIRKWVWKKNEFQIQYNKALGRELPKDFQRNWKAIQRALDRYSPKPYAGKLTLFRASNQPKGIVADPFLGWQGLPTEGLNVIESPGSHGAMTVDPYAKDLAALLLAFLRSADRAGSRTVKTPVVSSETFIGGDRLVQPHA